MGWWGFLLFASATAQPNAESNKAAEPSIQLTTSNGSEPRWTQEVRRAQKYRKNTLMAKTSTPKPWNPRRSGPRAAPKWRSN
eukprot:6671971-Pyramimonas_sp.AAC.1